MDSNRVAIVASAQTELRAAWSSAQHVDLIAAVVSMVFKGTGLSLKDVDFVIDSGSDVLDGRSISNCGFLGAMGAHHKEESRVEEDGLWAALYGTTKIAAGGGDVGLIIAYSKPSESDVGVFYSSQCEPFYQRPVGFGHLAASGIQAQRYLDTHECSETDLALIVTRRWDDARKHGRVAVEKPVTVNDVLGSELTAAPLRRLMLSRPMDGAVAVLLAGEEIARRATPRPVWVTGFGASMDRHSFATRQIDSLKACERAAAGARAQAGWRNHTPAVVEMSASSAVSELMVLEALGLAPTGGGTAVAEGTDAISVNRSGGALPADPIMATGLVRLAEAARQLVWPERYGLQAGASSALVHGSGGVGMQAHCVATLEV